MLYTTLQKIRDCNPCSDGWSKLLKHLGKTEADTEPLAFATILESNGLDDALWACRSSPEHNKHWRLYAVWCARQGQGLMQDPRSIAALDMAERHVNGTATDEELAAAWDAAWDAARDTARDAARSAARAAARAAAWDAAWDAARAAARAAAWAAARDTAWDAAWDAARAAAGDAQKAQFLALVTNAE